MKKEFPALSGKEIIILYDYIEKFGDEAEIELNKQLLKQLQNEIKELGFKSHLVSIKDDMYGPLKKFDPDKVVVFNWCEQFGDTPKTYHVIPYELDQMGFYYTGCGHDALLLTQDKIATKEVMVKGKVPTPVYKVYKRAGKFLNGWHFFPSIVKPESEHSSYGITKESVVDDHEQLTSQINYVLKNYEGGALVEQFINGTEYMVSVWGNTTEDIEVLPLLELNFDEIKDYHNKIYSYNAKWDSSSMEFSAIVPLCPAPVDKETETRIKDAAKLAYLKTGCFGYARIDIRVENGFPYVVDVNANPDMTAESEFVTSAAALGYNYGGTILKLCEIALNNPKLINRNVDVGISLDPSIEKEA